MKLGVCNTNQVESVDYPIVEHGRYDRNRNMVKQVMSDE